VIFLFDFTNILKSTENQIFFSLANVSEKNNAKSMSEVTRMSAAFPFAAQCGHSCSPHARAVWVGLSGALLQMFSGFPLASC
jgi:hypothetical protein